MNTRRLYLIIIAAVIALAIAFAIRTARQPRSEDDNKPGPLIPQLRDHVNDVSALTITGAEGKPIATLKRGEKGWTLAERADYPADVGKIRELLLKLDQSNMVEAKTINPARYADVGVEDVKTKDAKSVRVELAGLAQPVAVIIGKSNAPNGAGTFARRDGDAQTWLVSGNIVVPRNTPDWEKRDLADIPGVRFKSVTMTAPDGKKAVVFKETAADQNFKLEDVPAGREPGTDYTLNIPAATFAALKAEDVAPAKEMPAPQDAAKAQYVAFDGLILDAVTWAKDGKNYAQFSAKLDPVAAAAKIEADQAKAKADYEIVVAAANKSAADKPAGSPPADAASTATKDSGGDKAAGTPAQPEAASAPVKPLAVSDPQKYREEKLAALNKEVETLNQAFSGWTFVIQPHRYNAMTRTTENLLKEILTSTDANAKDAKGVNAREVNPAVAKAMTKPAPAKN